MITIKKIGVLPLLMSAIAVYGMNFDAENEAEWESTIEKGSQAATYYSYGVHGSQQIDKKDLKAFEYSQAIEAEKERAREESLPELSKIARDAGCERGNFEGQENKRGVKRKKHEQETTVSSGSPENEKRKHAQRVSQVAPAIANRIGEARTISLGSPAFQLAIQARGGMTMFGVDNCKLTCAYCPQEYDYEICLQMHEKIEHGDIRS